MTDGTVAGRRWVVEESTCVLWDRLVPAKLRKSLVGLYVTATGVESETRIELKVFVRAVRFRDADRAFFAGTRGAQVELEVFDAEIVDHTDHGTTQVEHTRSEGTATRLGAGAGPSIEAAVPGGKVGTSATLKAEAETSARSDLRWQQGEQAIASVSAGRLATWDLAPAPGVFRSFFFKNAAFGATVKWSGSERRAHAAVWPDGVDFFDKDRRPLGRVKSALMHAVLKRWSEEVAFAYGIRSEFKVVAGEADEH